MDCSGVCAASVEEKREVTPGSTASTKRRTKRMTKRSTKRRTKRRTKIGYYGM